MSRSPESIHANLEIPKLLDFSVSSQEIWEILRTNAAAATDSGLALGFMLAQVLRERPYKHLRCKNFKHFCEILGISDRKGRHLILTALSWQDACHTLGQQLPPPANFPLAEKLFLAKEHLSSDLYCQFVTNLYNPDIRNSRVADDLNAILLEISPQENDFVADLKRIRNIVQVAQMAAADCAFLNKFLTRLGKNDNSDINSNSKSKPRSKSESESESEFEQALRCLDNVIAQLEVALATEQNDDTPVALADRGRPNLQVVDMARHPSRLVVRELH